jgi:tetratricopeptide (TPR) repeat protein
VQNDLKRLKRDLGTDSQLTLARTGRSVKRKPAASFPRNKTGIGLGIAVCLIIMITWVLIREPFKKTPSPANVKDHSIAIMYFENMAQPGDKERLGDIITNLLITDLSESRYVSVVSNQRLYDILKLMGKEGIKRIDRSVASEVAARAKTRWMLLGNILTVEPRIVITTQLVDVKSGRVEASQRVTGKKGQDVFPLVDRLAVEIRNDLALPAAAAQEPDRPVADVTTHSREAYRYYIEGYDYYYKLNHEEAEKSFRKALEHDPTFAMAYYMLSKLLDVEWNSRRKDKMIDRAVKYSQKAGLKEKYLINSRAARIAGKISKAIDILEKLVVRFPYDKEACLELGLFYNINSQPDKALYYIKRAIEIDPLYKIAYKELAYVYYWVDGGNIEKAIRAVDKYISLAPNEPRPYFTKGYVYLSYGRLEQAIESFEKASDIQPGVADWELGNLYLYKRDYEKADNYYRKLAADKSKFWRAGGRASLALIPLHQGKLRETLKILDDGIAADKMERVKSFPLALKYMVKAYVYMEMKEFALALKVGETAIEILNKTDPFSKLSWEGYHAWFLGANNRFEKINEIAEKIKKDQKNTDSKFERTHWHLLGWCEFSRGNHEAAISYFEQSLKEEPSFLDYYLLAKSCLDTGRWARAIKGF